MAQGVCTEGMCVFRAGLVASTRRREMIMNKRTHTCTHRVRDLINNTHAPRAVLHALSALWCRKQQKASGENSAMLLPSAGLMGGCAGEIL
jgi:hypothetical protein